MYYCEDKKMIMLGDRLSVGILGKGGTLGVVVCSLDTKEFSDDYPESAWGFLNKGILVETENFGLIHYAEADPELIFLSRADE